MVDIPKPKKYWSYEGADAAAKAFMDPLLDFVDRRQTMAEEMKTFGAEAELRFRQSVCAIEKFLEDPMSPEADQSIKDALRTEYIAAADNMALTLCAGEEALKRYEQHHLENIAELISIEPDDASHQDLLMRTIKARDALYDRVEQLSKPEQSHDFVCRAIERLEGGRQFSVSISRGMPLDESISVRKSPLKLQRPGMRP